MKILLTGATGFIGSRLKSRLEERGHTVAAVSRSPGKGYDWSPESLTQGVAWADAVCNLAGENLFGKRWSEKQKQELWRSRVETTKQLARTAAEQGLQRFVSASAIGYYGASETAEFDEHAPVGDGFLAKLCRDWEEATEAALEAGISSAIVRIGVVMGQGGGALEKMLPPFRLGVGGPLGSGRQWVSWVHIDDLVALFCELLEDPARTGVFNGVAPNPVRMKELAKTLGGALHRPAVLPVPSPVLKLVVGEAAEVLLTGQKVRPARTLESGFAFRYRELAPALEHLVGERPTATAAT